MDDSVGGDLRDKRLSNGVVWCGEMRLLRWGEAKDSFAGIGSALSLLID